MLRAASIGLGWWSDELAEAVQGRSEAIRVASCYSRSAEKRAAFAEKFGTAQHDSYEAVLADPEIDAVILTTPHSQHAEQVIQAAGAGKQVFVEKPFTLTAASGRAAAQACARAGVVLAVGQNRRFCAAAQALRGLMDAGAFGTVLHLEANISAPGGLGYTPERWRANRVESPGGALAGLAVHLIDLLCWLAGPARRITAQAKRRAVPVDIDDTTSVLIDFESGATGYLGTLFACPNTSFLNVYGTEANAFAAIAGNELKVQLPGLAPEARPLEPVDTLKVELEEFARACAGGPAFRVRPEEAIHNVAVMEAIVASAAHGSAPVEIPAEPAERGDMSGTRTNQGVG
jgi:predicted dehydrogenase